MAHLRIARNANPVFSGRIAITPIINKGEENRIDIEIAGNYGVIWFRMTEGELRHCLEGICNSAKSQ